MTPTLLSILFCSFAILNPSYGQSRVDGILYDHKALGLRPYYPPQTMRNNRYPDPAPHDLIQTWRWIGLQISDFQTAIKVTCKKVSIPKRPDKDDCGDYALSIEDDKKNYKLCGDIGEYTILSQTNELNIELKTGPGGGGIVDCTAQAVLVTPDRLEITTTTTTTPKPTQPAYQDIASEEVNSEEHGVGRGIKPTSCRCGWSNKVLTFSRVVNGTETARNEFPFAAGLTYRGSRGRFCGATIITSHHALTAAHCTDGETASELSILVGMHNVHQDTGGPADEINIERIIQHNGFSRSPFINDISLLIMEREIKFNQYVGPACLPQSSPPLQLYRKYIKIIGWGADKMHGPSSAVLKKVNVRVVPVKECNYMYSDVRVEDPIQICTYSKSKSSCQGDSGGPVMWLDEETNRYTHVGIVSFGRVCGDISPSVHTRVQAYIDWIQYHIRASNKPNSYTCSKTN